MLGFNSYSDFGKTENLQEDLNAIENSFKTNVIENSSKTKIITSITSETLAYRPDLFSMSQ
jgi:hypothetical protein